MAQWEIGLDTLPSSFSPVESLIVGEAQNPVWVLLRTDLNFHSGPQNFLVRNQSKHQGSHTHGPQSTSTHHPVYVAHRLRHICCQCRREHSRDSFLKVLGTPRMPQKRENDTFPEGLPSTKECLPEVSLEIDSTHLSSPEWGDTRSIDHWIQEQLFLKSIPRVSVQKIF